MEGLHIDNDHFMIISPDEGSMRRAIYLANVLGVDMGMYYRRLDYSKMVKGRHPIAAYEFLGPKLEGKDVILIDDMISSGNRGFLYCHIVIVLQATPVFFNISNSFFLPVLTITCL